MPISTRCATSDDTSRIREIFLAAFEKEDEADLWAHLLAHDTLLSPGDVRLALDSDHPVSATILQRRPIRSRGGWVPGAIVNLVACDPAVQGKGFGSAAVRDAIARMTDEGMAVGILYGVKEYYPRFGFAPVLPLCRTEVAAADLASFGSASFRTADDDDLPGLAALYSSHYEQYPCAVSRDANPHLWSVRVPEFNAVRVLPNRKGYAVIHRGSSYLWVREAAGADVEAGRQVLAAICQEAGACGLSQVVMGLPPDHPLVDLVRLVPFKQVQANASYGMVIITDWSRVLPLGYRVDDEGLWLDSQLVVRASRHVLTQLVMGYRSAGDLPMMADVQVTAGAADWSRLTADFPAAFPKWSLDPFWEGARVP